jgi:drug/metabolite transporter (DMT)-like permease
MRPSKKGPLQHLILLNIGVFCISTSGVLGRSILLQPTQTIFWRSLIAFVCLTLYCWFSQNNLLTLFRKAPGALLVSGLLLGVHWITYFYALQWSSVAIGMLSLYTFPIFTAFLEPLFGKDRFQPKHLFLGLALLLGIYLISPPVNWENQQFLAIGMGIFSAVCFSFRNLFIKKISKQSNGTALMATQVFVVSLALLPMNFVTPKEVIISYGSLLFFLALVTTVIGHSLFLQSFQKFSITTSSLISCLQPLYGILMGALLLDEIPKPQTLLGGSIILLAVGVEMYSFEKK